MSATVRRGRSRFGRRVGAAAFWATGGVVRRLAGDGGAALPAVFTAGRGASFRADLAAGRADDSLAAGRRLRTFLVVLAALALAFAAFALGAFAAGALRLAGGLATFRAAGRDLAAFDFFALAALDVAGLAAGRARLEADLDPLPPRFTAFLADFFPAARGAAVFLAFLAAGRAVFWRAMAKSFPAFLTVYR
jgi:hypothetical protein